MTVQARTVVVERVPVPMRDGVRLAATVHHTGAPRPVLLTRTPYDESLTRALPVTPALERGFTVVVQSCRGTGGSEGEFSTFEAEPDDGLDTIAWLRTQPWSDGRIVMLGPSYLGMVQLAVSGLRPEGLVAIAPSVTPDDFRDGLVYRQGVFALGPGISWHLLKAAMTLKERAGRGEDVRAAAARLAELAADPAGAYRKLPLTDRPGISGLVSSWRTWLDREADHGYWRSISYAGRRAATAVPGLHVGGWFDVFLRGTLGNFTTIPGSGQRLIVGPWAHADQTGVVGERVYPGGGAAHVRLEEQQLRFLRETLDGVPSSLPPVQIYVMGADMWRAEQEWPLARTDRQTWYLAADGSLGKQLPAAGEAEFVHDPHDPVPTVGGALVLAGTPDGGPAYQPGSRDQRVLDQRADILRFTSPVLDHDLEVTGPLTVRLFVGTSAADADFTAKLVDVHPEGHALGIADGIVRLRYRAGMDAPRTVRPGAVYEVSVDLGATSQVFKTGHRVRVDVASANFPNYDRNSGSGKLAGQVVEADLVPATQRVRFGAGHPSSILLPVIPNRGASACSTSESTWGSPPSSRT